jgi:hypothetical protein
LRLGAALATTVAGAALLYGCGDGDGETTGAAASTNLTIELDADGSGGQPASRKQAICEEGMDTSPCPQLAALTAADLAPVPPTTPCTEIFGGPDVVTVAGTLHGQPVDATLTRRNGCEIERFERFVPVLQELYPDYKPGASLTP